MSIFKKKGGQISATSIPMTEAEAALAQSDFNIEKITEIQNKFTGGAVLLVPGRIFIREGLLWKVCRKGIKKRQFFLFNDILVYGSVVASRYSNQHSLALDKMSVSSECFYQPRVQSDFDTDAESLDQQLDSSNAFQISHADKSFHVFASSSADKANWLANLTKHISRAAQSVADSPQQMVTRPVWVPDAVAKECMVCQTRFSTFVRKHHCRRCGRVVCSACSPHHVSLTAADSALLGHAPSEHSKLERVCKECFKEMTAQHNRSNSQSRSLRDSKVQLSPTPNSSAVVGFPATGRATVTKPTDQDSTDTEDSDDSSDEKEKQSVLEEQSKASSHLKGSTESRQSGPSLARTGESSTAEEGTGELEIVAADVRQLSIGRDIERDREGETQPTPPPRKKKLEKLLRKQIEESQKLIKKEESSVGEYEEQGVLGEETDNTTPPGATPRKARRKNKHSKPQDSDLQLPAEQETTTADDSRADEAPKEVKPSNTEAEGEQETTLEFEEREMVDGTTIAGEEAPAINDKPEGEVDQEHSLSASQKRGRGRRKKFKTVATSERTDDAAAPS